MAKRPDPRFNFYPDNYEGGTEFFTLEQDGAYLRLLIMQFRRGQFTEKEAIIKLSQRCHDQPGRAKTLWGDLKSKFETDGTNFWSARLRLEMDKSLQYSEDQAERAKNGWDKRKQPQSPDDAKPMPTHMPETSPDDASNSNSISNSTFKTTSNSNSTKKTASPGLFSTIPENWDLEKLTAFWGEFEEMRKMKKKPLTKNAAARRLTQLIEVSGGSWAMAEKIILKAIDKAWDEFYPLTDPPKPISPKSNGIANELRPDGKRDRP